MKKRYWETQPVSNIGNIGNNNNTNTNNNNTNNTNIIQHVNNDIIHQLNNTYNTYNNTNYIFKYISDINIIITFLNNNYYNTHNTHNTHNTYSTYSSDNYKFIFTYDMFNMLFNSKRHKECYSIGLYINNSNNTNTNILYNDNTVYNDNKLELIGYVFGKVHSIYNNSNNNGNVLYNDTVYNDNILYSDILSVNFLCVSKHMRHNNIAPMLINEIKRNAYINGIYTAIFTGERNLGFAFTEVEYYHYILNINRLRKLIYIPYDYINSTNTIYNDNILNSSIYNSNILNSSLYNDDILNNSLYNSNTRLINNDDDNDFIYINQLLLKYNQCNVCNIQLYEVFNDIDALRDNFKIIDNFNYTLINKQEGTFITFYIMYIDNKLYDTNNSDLYDNNNINSNNSNNSNNTILYDNNSKYIKKAILQYHNIGNNTNNTNNIQILDDAFTFCKSMGVDMFDVLNIAGNDIHIIDKYPFLHGTGKLYYHFYNYNMLPIGRSKINFILY